MLFCYSYSPPPLLEVSPSKWVSTHVGIMLNGGRYPEQDYLFQTIALMAPSPPVFQFLAPQNSGGLISSLCSNTCCHDLPLTFYSWWRHTW